MTVKRPLANYSGAIQELSVTDILPVDKIAEIIASKSHTVVDIFIYDTSNDSDDGAWRKRCSHLSWYNETLNTATRGATREFPAVALIVAESNKVTIYDATDPDCPMWRVVDLTGLTITAIAAANGLIVIATTTGVAVDSYIGDDLADTTLEYTTATTPAIVNNSCNDIATTTLPDAPTDQATGLPVPTIAVPTNGGGSWIKDDETVADATGAITLIDCDITTTGFTVWASATKLYVFNSIPTSDIALTSADYIFDTAGTSGPHISGTISSVVLDGTDIKVGTNEGIFLVKYDQTTPANSIVAQITKGFFSGGMRGDIKGAWLADTDDTDLVGSELVTNGDFDTDTDWTKGTGWTISGGVASSDGSQTADSLLTTSTVPTTVADTRYIVSFEVTAYTSGNVALKFDGSEVITDKAATGIYFATVTASDTTGTIDVAADLDFVGSVDNVSLRLADIDRSVNDNGLAVHGTITKTAVATGAELVAYSGFSTDNYLEQPYNSDLDFGTGDFYIMGWFKKGPNVVGTLCSRGVDSNQDGVFEGAVITINFKGTNELRVRLSDDGLATTDIIETSNNYTDNKPHFFVFYIKSSVGYLYVDGVQVASQAITAAAGGFTNTSATLMFGRQQSASGNETPLTDGSLICWRIGIGYPLAAQIKHIYNTEKHLFVEDADCTLAGTSDSILALDFDDITEQLHAMTSYGRSTFQGLRMVESEATAVGTPSAVSATGGRLAQGGSTAAKIYIPEIILRDELARQEETGNPLGLELFWFTGDGTETDFILPIGWKPKFVYDAGLLQKEGASADYEVEFDGFLYTVSFGTAPTNLNDIGIMSVRS